MTKTICMATVGATPDGFVFPIRCKRWSCPVCARINAYHHAIKVANGCQAMITAGIIPRFVTITQPSGVRTAQHAYKILHEQWDKFRRRLQYWAKTRATMPVIYASFVEGQPKREFMPHFHIILSASPKKEALRLMVVQSGLGFQLDLQTFKTGSGVAWYVAKYATKADDAKNMPKGFRRVRYSENFPPMWWCVDDAERIAIVKEFHESYLEWIDRCARAGVDVRKVETNLINLLELTSIETENSVLADIR